MEQRRGHVRCRFNHMRRSTPTIRELLQDRSWTRSTWVQSPLAFSGWNSNSLIPLMRRGAGAVERGGLENLYLTFRLVSTKLHLTRQLPNFINVSSARFGFPNR